MNLIQSSNEEKLAQRAKNNQERQKRYYNANKAKMAEIARKKYQTKKQLQAAVASDRLNEVTLLSQWYNFNCDEAMQRLNAPLPSIVEEVEEEVLTCSKPFLWTPAYVIEQQQIRSVASVTQEIVYVTSDDSTSPRKQYKTRETPTGCRKLSNCLVDGQRLRTAVAVIKYPNLPQMEGVYHSRWGKIACGDKFYSLNQFVQLQIKMHMQWRGKSIDAWENCLCEIDGKWVSMFNLPEISD